MVKAELQRVLEGIVGGLGANVSINVEYPPEGTDADYASNAALAAAKELGKPPKEVAEDIKKGLEAAQLPFVKEVSVAGPGFVNITLARGFFAQAIARAISEGEEWGRNANREGDKVMVEYTSPNLFKPLHVGNLMSNIIGESVARLIEAIGADVSRANYASDIGLSVAKGVWGLCNGSYDPKDISQLGKAYQEGAAAYEDNPEAMTAIDVINKALYEGSDAELSGLREQGIKTSLHHLMGLCHALGTEKFDVEIFESQSGPIGRDIVKEHISDGIFEESDGAIIFKGEKYGLHTRVFINSAGLPTYEAKDIGLVKLKVDAYPFDQSITVTGHEQKEYFKVVIKAIEAVFPKLRDKLLHIPYGLLNLPSGKMSSRKGNIITGESLLEDLEVRIEEKSKEREHKIPAETNKMVAVAAIKYIILKQGTGKDVIFDPEKSLSLEGDSGPYLQYAHVRAASILRKAAAENIQADTSTPSELSHVERLLIRFPEIVERAASLYEPHYVAQYLTELSSAFNSWYTSTKVLDGTPEAAYKLALVDATRQTLKNGLYLLGIKAPEEM